MSLEIFEKILRQNCKKYYADLSNGERINRLQKRRELNNSMTDLIKRVEKIGYTELYTSCIRSLGYVMEDTARDYAKAMGATVEKKIKQLNTEIDLVFIIGDVVYNLESKVNIELDSGKTANTHRRLKRIHNAIDNLLDCEVNHLKLITKLLAWTKPTADDAMRVVKKPLTKDMMMGYAEFFQLFNVIVTQLQYEDMIRRVWKEEVEDFFTPKANPQKTLGGDGNEEK